MTPQRCPMSDTPVVLGAQETCPCYSLETGVPRSFELPCRPASSVLRYRADPGICLADVNFLFLALWQIGSLLEECDSSEGGSGLAAGYRRVRGVVQLKDSWRRPKSAGLLRGRKTYWFARDAG